MIEIALYQPDIAPNAATILVHLGSRTVAMPVGLSQ